MQAEYYQSTVVYFILNTSEKGCPGQIMKELTKFTDSIEKYLFILFEKHKSQSIDKKEILFGVITDDRVFNDILKSLSSICNLYYFIYCDQLYDNNDLVFDKDGIKKYVNVMKIIITTIKFNLSKNLEKSNHNNNHNNTSIYSLSNSTQSNSHDNFNDEHCDKLLKIMLYLLKLMSNISFGNNIDSQVSTI
jgi:hypothetical protein